MFYDHPIIIHTYADDRTEVMVHTGSGTLRLEISPTGAVAVAHPERAVRLGRRHKFRLFFSLEGNDNLRGWYVAEEHDPPDPDVITQFATKKNRRPKPEPMQ